MKHKPTATNDLRSPLLPESSIVFSLQKHFRALANILAISLATSVLASPRQADSGKPSYTEPGFANFDPHQTFRSVGIFGSFGKGVELQERDHAGLPTFTLRKDAPENTMVWANFLDGKDLTLGHAVFPGTVVKKQFEFVDWTTAKLNFATIGSSGEQKTSVYFSRSFPAVLYDTESHGWTWKPGDIQFDRIAFRNALGQVTIRHEGSKLESLGAPWIIVWAHPQNGSDVIPILVRFQTKPETPLFKKELQAEFSEPAKGIIVMPLYGIHRQTVSHRGDWDETIPSNAVTQATFWSRASAAFPIGINETFDLIEDRSVVRITDKVVSRIFADAWGTLPLQLTPVSPVTAVSEASKYPVKWLTKVSRSPLATLLGPFAYAEGAEVSYEIPIPSARDTMLAPVKVIGDPVRQLFLGKLSALATRNVLKPDDTSDGGLDLQLKEYSQAYPLLDRPTQASLAPKMARAFEASFAPENLQTVTDPVIGQRYVMCSKIWCAGEPYDREWYIGRQLDFDSEYTSWVSPKAFVNHWKEIQGLYAYYQIYNDWAWSGTLSSVFAYALCADGMNFAMEGMLGVARMARRVGDLHLWRDATYRAAKEALCTYGSWYLTDWVKSQDYVTWTDTSYDYEKKRGRYEIHRMPPADAQTGFGLDIYSDTTGIKVFRNGSFWHASAAVYWNNPSLYRFYNETLYSKVYKWEYETLPQLHPNWLDREATERFSNQPYGNNLVIAHLDARSVLFGDSPERLAPLMEKLQPDIALLYKLRANSDLAQAGVPQVWVPEAQAEITEVEWDTQKNQLTVSLLPLSSGLASLDWNWRGRSAPASTPDAGPKPNQVLVQGKSAAYHPYKGGFFRLPLRLVMSNPVTIRIQY